MPVHCASPALVPANGVDYSVRAEILLDVALALAPLDRPAAVEAISSALRCAHEAGVTDGESNGCDVLKQLHDKWRNMGVV